MMTMHGFPCRRETHQHQQKLFFIEKQTDIFWKVVHNQINVTIRKKDITEGMSIYPKNSLLCDNSTLRFPKLL